MGVRFECPQGHKLHVKAHLAGQRGICPECGLRFIVPSFSGGRVAEASVSDSGSRSGYVSVSMESTASFNAALEATGSAGDEDSATWYVRPASGGQFGPIDTAGFRQWIEEGRVGADAWVWRTGWSDWRPGAQAARALTADKPRARSASGTASTTSPLPSSASTSGSSNARRTNGGAPVSAAAQAAPAHATPHRAAGRTPALAGARSANGRAADSPGFSGADLDELFQAPRNGESPSALMPPVMGARVVRDKRRKSNQLLTIVLASVALVLMVVLIIVLRRGGGESETTPIEDPAAISTPAG